MVCLFVLDAMFIVLLFNFCSLFLKSTTGRELNSVGELSDWISSAYSYLAMVDYPLPSSFLMPLPASPIKEVSLPFMLSISFNARKGL